MLNRVRGVWLYLTLFVVIGCASAQRQVQSAPWVASGPQGARTVAVPSDVRPNHWARKSVQEVLQAGVMNLPDGRSFHGEAKVTRTQAVIALARLAQSLETGKWKAATSAPISSGTAQPKANAPGWRKQMVTRYMLASVLARFGDYVANGLHRPGPNDKALGQSEALPDKVTVTVPASNPAYASLVYLAKNRMIGPDSPLLKPDDKLLRGGELSRALAQMVAGLNDRLTDIGHDSEGNTIDINSAKPGKPHR